MKVKFKIFLIVVCHWLTLSKSIAQINLVLNPSFEQLKGCPNGWNQADSAKYWNWINTNCDTVSNFYCKGELYTPCCTNPPYCSVPFSNFAGFQNPRTGSNYIGLASVYTLFPPINNLRDYLKGQLSNTLQVGKNYCLTFYYSTGYRIEYATNRFGAYVDNGAVGSYNCCRDIPIIPQAQNNPTFFMTDTMNWVKIQGSFTAIGNENTITLGNFVDSATTQYQLFNINGSSTSYYLIDDVSLIQMDLPAYAGRDTSICNRDSTYIGRPREVGLDDDCIWYVLGNNTPLDTIAGLWVKPNIATSYVVEQNICGTITFDTVNVSIKSNLPSLNLSNTYSICQNDSVQIGQTALSNVTYTWSPSLGLNNTTLAQPNASPSVSQIYTVTVIPTGSVYCSGNITGTVNVIVKPKLKGNISLTVNPQNICPNIPAQLQAITSNNTGLQWNWQPNNLVSNSTISNPTANPNVNTTYTLITTANNTSFYCGADTSKIYVRVIKLQAPPFAGYDTTVCKNVTVQIGTSNNICTWCTYNWFPSSLVNNSHAANTAVDLPFNISSQVLILAQTDSCQTTTDNITISTKDCRSDSILISIPNIFTPNNDGKNDTWSMIVVNGLQIFDIQTTIYNRWGKKVFESTNINQNWNGHNLYEGSLCNPDTYFYTISYTDGNTNQTKILKGFIELIW